MANTTSIVTVAAIAAAPLLCGTVNNDNYTVTLHKQNTLLEDVVAEAAGRNKINYVTQWPMYKYTSKNVNNPKVWTLRNCSSA